MGVSSTTNRLVYTGSGSTTSFSFPYYFFAQSDLLVYLYDTVAGGTTLQTLGTNYTISGTTTNGLYLSGGSVVFSVAPSATTNVIITRNPSLIQNFALSQNGIISSTALVQQLDYITLLIQRLEDQIGRSALLPDGFGASFSTIMPELMNLFPGYALVVNGSGTGFALAAITGGGGGGGFTNPMTTLGDLIYGAVGGLATRLPGDVSNTRKFLRSLSSGGIASSPVWDSLLATDIPVLNQNTTGTASNITGVCAVTNGGTGQSATLTQYGIIYAASTALMACTGAGTAGQVLTSNGTSAPTWQNNAVNVMTTPGDMIYENGSSVPTRLPIGSSYQVLQVNSAGTLPSYGPVNLGQSNAVTGTLPNSNTTAASSATASTIVSRDANANTTVNNLVEGFATTATAAGTTTLTNASKAIQQFTGTTTQTVVLPDATTLALGFQFQIFNRSTGSVTVQQNGGTTLQAMLGGSQMTATCTSIASAAGTWDVSYTLTSTLPVSLGGTGQSSNLTADGVVYASSATAMATTAVGTAGNVLTSNGPGSAPTFQAPTTGFANPMTTLGDIIYENSTPTAARLAGNTSTTQKFLTQTGTGSASAAPAWTALTAPTVQRFTSSSGTYTTPAGILYIKVTLAGAGGGGGGAGASSPTAGGTGGNTTFGTSLLTAGGGSGGAATAGNNQGGAGGSNTTAGTVLKSIAGAAGQGGWTNASAGGGSGGGTALGGGGGAGAGGTTNGSTGQAGPTNSGAGGGGAGGSNTYGSGAGGGSGGYMEVIITSPSATYAYAVGAAGSAGTGTFNGGAGGSGLIVVEEFYQ